MTNNKETMNYGTSRREFLKFAGFAALGVAMPEFRNLFPSIIKNNLKLNEGNGSLTATAEASLGNNASQTEIKSDLSNDGSYETSGIPDKIDTSQVDIAKDKFRNTIGNGSEAFFAEPGKLLVGPGYDFDLNWTPEQIKNKINEAGDFSPVNQVLYEQPGPSYCNVAEGGFLITTAGYMTATFPDGITIKLHGNKDGNLMWFLVVRGLYSAEGDRNTTMKLTDYKPGHIQSMRYPGVPNGGFISEKQLKQMAEMGHKDATNCGNPPNGGCNLLKVAMFDLNTKAFAIMQQYKINGSWEKVVSNF